MIKLKSILSEARSINSIENELSKVVKDMKSTVALWKAAEGSKKQSLQTKLKTLTSKKKELEKELDDAVGLVDINAELQVDESIFLSRVLSEEKEAVSLADDIQKYVRSNKTKIKKLISTDDWKEIYQLGFDKFPESAQDDVAQAMNLAIAMCDFGDEEKTEMPTEKELETKVFGEKSQQKGIKMGDYDKKNKLPKPSPVELVVKENKTIKNSFGRLVGVLANEIAESKK